MPQSNPNLSAPRPSLARRIMSWLLLRWRLVTVGIAGVLVGWTLMAGWVTAIEHTNHTEFCITCHVMADTVYVEYKKSSHFTNKFGAHASCPDCHVPQYSWFEEAKAKVATAKELYAFFFQGMSKVENFEKIRPQLAQEVWDHFEATNARECRHCHDYSSMKTEEQAPSARAKHETAAATNQNCVACHKGITHKNYAVKAEEPAPTDFDVN